MSPYHLATKGLTPTQRAAWFRAHGAPANDGSVPTRFLCDGAENSHARRDALTDEEGGEYYNQAHYAGTGRAP
jgi:hypothetical protein